MEKLKELLNEFDPYISKDGEHRDNLWYGVICGESAVYWKGNGIQKIISKEYGFIKWLVDNDKIDLDKLDKPEYIDLGDDFMKLSDSDYLIMLLSIQDNPIEFLVSILK